MRITATNPRFILVVGATLAVLLALALLNAVDACERCGNVLGGPPPGRKYSTCCDASSVDACKHEPIDPWFITESCEYYEGITGIPCKTREYFMRKALDVQRHHYGGTMCPLIAFGSVIVNHTGPGIEDAEILCVGENLTTERNHAYHAEVTAFENCSELFKEKFGPNAHKDNTLWQQLTLYTTAEPCPMDAQMYRFGKIGEIVYATTMRDMTNAGWTQPGIYMEDIQRANNWCRMGSAVPEGAWGGTNGKTSYQTRLIKGLLRNEMLPHFVWALNPSARCPDGCHRPAEGQPCTDIRPPAPIPPVMPPENPPRPPRPGRPGRPGRPRSLLAHGVKL